MKKKKKTIDIDSRIYHYQKLVFEAHKKGSIDMAFLDNVFYMLLSDFKKVIADEVIKLKTNHINPNCLDGGCCNSHSETGGVTHDLKKHEKKATKKVRKNLTMKQDAEIKVYPVDKSDGEKAKLLQELLNHKLERGDYKSIFEEIVAIKSYVKAVYRIDLPINLIDRLIKEIIKLEAENIERMNNLDLISKLVEDVPNLYLLPDDQAEKDYVIDTGISI